MVMKKFRLVGAYLISLAFGSALLVPTIPQAVAGTVVYVPRAPVVRVTPRVGPTVRPHARSTTSSYFWWLWSSPQPCKKQKNGRCRG
jgi:hypothetical protein